MCGIDDHCLSCKKCETDEAKAESVLSDLLCDRFDTANLYDKLRCEIGQVLADYVEKYNLPLNPWGDEVDRIINIVKEHMKAYETNT